MGDGEDWVKKEEDWEKGKEDLTQKNLHRQFFAADNNMLQMTCFRIAFKYLSIART